MQMYPRELDMEIPNTKPKDVALAYSSGAEAKRAINSKINAMARKKNPA